MFTYSAINLAVTFGVLGAGFVGFLGGWLAHRALTRERRRAASEEFYDA